MTYLYKFDKLVNANGLKMLINALIKESIV